MAASPWTANQILVLRELWDAGMMAKDIAKHPAIDRTEQSVFYKADQLGLPRRYGRGGGWRVDPENRAERVRVLFTEMGWPPHRIAIEIGAHVNTVYNIIRARNYHRGTVDIRHPQGKNRRCMTCGTKFWSQHWGVRMCDKCRAAADTGMAEYSIQGWAA